MVDALGVHVPQARSGLTRAVVGEVAGLLRGDGRFGVDVAHVDGALDVVLHAGASEADDVDLAGPHIGDGVEVADVGLAVDDDLIVGGVVPHGGLEGLELVLGEVLGGHLPDEGRLDDVGVAVEGGEVLGHGLRSAGWAWSTSCQRAWGVWGESSKGWWVVSNGERGAGVSSFVFIWHLF